MGPRKGIPKASSEFLICHLILAGLSMSGGVFLQIWQHRKEAVRAKVAQRMNVVRRTTYHRLCNKRKAELLHETMPARHACLGDS